MTTGATVWLTGLPSAGKTTIARELAGRLREEGRRVELLDGDEIREFLSAGLGFSRADRHTNVQRIGFVAELLARNGVTALVPVIAPYADSRDAVRERHEANGTAYVEVHVATPVEVCSVRDVKGLYAKQAAGEISGLTGVDDPYEEPLKPDLRIESQDQTVQESAAAVHALLTEGDWHDDDRRCGAGGHGRPVRPLPPRRPRVRGGAHLPRGGGRVRAAGDPLLRRQGLHRHAAPGAEGVRARAGPVLAAARGHRAQLPRGPGVPRPHGGPARAASARGLRAGLHRPGRAQGAPGRHPQPAADPAADREDPGREVRRRLRRRAPRRGEGPGQGAGVLAARRVLPVGPAPPAPRAVEPVQRPARPRRARPRLPALQLDRAGRVAVHRPRGHRTAGDLLRPRARGLLPVRHVADRRRVGRPEGRRDGREAAGPLPHRRRHVLHRRRRLRRRQHREGDRRDRRLPAHRARRHACRRQDVRGRDGRPQARGYF